MQLTITRASMPVWQVRPVLGASCKCGTGSGDVDIPFALSRGLWAKASGLYSRSCCSTPSGCAEVAARAGSSLRELETVRLEVGPLAHDSDSDASHVPEELDMAAVHAVQ